MVWGDRRYRPRPRQRRDDQAVVSRVLGGASPPLDGWGVRELHDGRGPGTGAGHLPRKLRASGTGQEEVRPKELLPREPEHQARRLRSPGSTLPSPPPGGSLLDERADTLLGVLGQ